MCSGFLLSFQTLAADLSKWEVIVSSEPVRYHNNTYLALEVECRRIGEGSLLSQFSRKFLRRRQHGIVIPLVHNWYDSLMKIGRSIQHRRDSSSVVMDAGVDDYTPVPRVSFRWRSEVINAACFDVNGRDLGGVVFGQDGQLDGTTPS